ncbi:hypothetical protein BXZ70DRAFT_88074 [Cristinia sonorae]|uniref:GYF domain-containing protein n=1 Tax=Cristinia sonorae TaxID=1940300 RepID=A0A8K0XR33_9AGAR|nr:hypothetical protein BXZ70DRAFT_88074 [Cristinia sonorae]
MTTTTMHFGPEWMRAKQPPARTAPSPPLATPQTTSSAATPSSYSSLVAPAAQPAPDKHDLSRPFRFSKDDLLRIYKEGGGRGGLGLEVERWEGIVREVGSDPVGLKEMSEGEKKIFAGPLNSEVRRRQSTDYLSPLTTDRPKLGHLNSGGPASPLRERMGNFVGRRRDSTDQPPLTLPRKQSLSSMQGPLQSPRDAPLPSPRTRLGASGFDGGVLDGTWTSKRKAAEAAAAARAGVKDNEKLGLDEKINEEEETSLGNGHNPPDKVSAPGEETVTANGSGGDAPASNSPSSQPTVTSDSNAIPSGPPPGLDLAAVDWSYLDPQGQVQGPFRADTMQKWYDGGYFTADLLMRRTHLETEWKPVRVLQQLAVDTPIFLTPLAPPRPPPEPPVSFATLNGTRYEPEINNRSISIGLNARLHDGSNPSDSPISSYSNPPFNNNSPDPATFAARGVNGSLDMSSNSYSSLNTLDSQRQSPHIMNPAAVGRNGLAEGYGLNGYGGAFGTGLDPHVGGGLNGYQQQQPNVMGGYNMSQSEASAALAGLRLDPQDLQPRYGGFANGGSPFPAYSPSPFIGQQDMRSLQQSTSPFPVRRASGSTHILPLQQQGMQQSFIPQSNIPSQASRVAQDPLGFRRPGPFDVNYPTAQNLVQQRTVTPSQASSYGSQPIHNGNLSADQSPWYSSSQGFVPEGWSQEPSNLTVANLDQHDQLQEQEVEKVVAEPEPEPAEPEPVAPGPQEAQESAAPSSPTVPTASGGDSARVKSRRKATAPTTAIAAAKPAATPAIAPALPTKPPTPSPPAAEPKPVWNVDEDKVATGVMSLREIQEAEAKKAEARKAAERERAAARAAAAAAAAATASSVAEPLQTFTASWGLPTSQAGSRNAGALVAKDSPSISTPAAPTTQAPVWTNAVKPTVAKKTMKEIQEEEEKRKKQALKEKESMAAAARRAYAETTTKPTTPVMTGGAWTTVGSSGKGNVAVATPPAPVAVARPAIPSSVSAKAIPTATMASTIVAAPAATRTLSNGAVPQRTLAGVAAAKVPAKLEESPAPSADFLKWLGDALKGLNSSVNLEEIASMLLQFPVDPDPSTVEIISDLIYANSTTLDGRRFAAEFVSRRKASTKAAPAAGKLSIADVVKTQPKPAQNEWSGFKVVNKKKKGGRV